MGQMKIIGLRTMLICAGLSVALPLCANTFPARCTAAVSHGISVSQAVVTVQDQKTVIEVRAFRPRSTRVLPTQTLKFAIIGADGIVRAEQRRLVGPAQLPREHSGHFLIAATLPTSPVAGDSIVVEWVDKDR